MKQEMTAAIIYKAVADAYETTADALTGRNGKRCIRRMAEARQVTAYLLKVHTDINLADIAKALQVKDKQYAAYGIQKTIGTLGLNLDFRILISRIELQMLEELAKEEKKIKVKPVRGYVIDG